MGLAAKDIKESIIVLVSLTLGGITGEILNIEGFLEKIGDSLSKKSSVKAGAFTQGFVAASLLFCVGPMAITEP